MVFPAHKQACTSFTGPPQWLKLLSRSFLALKQACSCFTAPPRRLKRLYRVSFPDKHRLARASQDLHSGENCFPRTYTGLHVFHSTGTAVNQPFQTFPAFKQVCTILTGHLGNKIPDCQIFHAHKQGHMSFTRPLQW